MELEILSIEANFLESLIACHESRDLFGKQTSIFFADTEKIIERDTHDETYMSLGSNYSKKQKESKIRGLSCSMRDISGVVEYLGMRRLWAQRDFPAFPLY